MADDHTPLDHRLECAVDRLTPPPDTEAVLVAVDRRRQAQRSARRRQGVAARSLVVVASLAACVVAFVTLRTDELDRVDSVADPAATADHAASAPGSTSSSVPSSAASIPGVEMGDAVTVPGRGPRITGIGSDPDGFWIARGDPLDAIDPEVSTVAHVDATGVIDVTAEIHGVPIVSAVTAGRLWLVAEDRVTSPTDRTRYRLKQIDTTTGQVLTSTPLPADAPLGVRATEDSVRIIQAEGEIVVDPGTLEIRMEDGASAVIESARQVVTSGATTWVLSTDPTMATVRDEDAGTTSAAVAVAGVDRLVVSDSWNHGAVVAAMAADDKVDLIELVPPATGSSDIARVRTRLTGLPIGTSLVAVTEEVAWLLVGDRLVPARPD